MLDTIDIYREDLEYQKIKRAAEKLRHRFMNIVFDTFYIQGKDLRSEHAEHILQEAKKQARHVVIEIDIKTRVCSFFFFFFVRV